MPAVRPDLEHGELVSVSEKESHSWNAGPLCDCLPPLTAAEFFLCLLRPGQTSAQMYEMHVPALCLSLSHFKIKVKQVVTPPASHPQSVWFKAAAAKICLEPASVFSFFSWIFSKTH